TSLSQPVFETAPTTDPGPRPALASLLRRRGAEVIVGDRMTNTPGLGYFVRNSAPLQFAVEGYLPLALAPTPLGGLPLVLSTVGSDEVAGVVARGDAADGRGRLRPAAAGRMEPLGQSVRLPARLAPRGLRSVGQRRPARDAGRTGHPGAIVDPYAFVYERGRYRLIFDRAMPGFGDTANELGVLRGFWMRRTVSNDAIELRYQPAVSTAVLRSVPGGGWSFTLTAATTAARRACCGAAPGLGRSLSIATPPAVGEPEVDLVLLQGTARLAGGSSTAWRAGTPSTPWRPAGPVAR
ncbi:MAG: hypothetical protein M5U09_28205, partial [Gammaproteobacteria bacterium]|nr:hypothetical protein [Gammaproteobacteria bacterium]